MYYIIETKDGIQIKVERDKYHSFKKMGKRKYVCQLCSTFCQRKGTHILSEKHLEKVSSPIKDKHCVREVDASITHCILCNELIESYLLHTVCNNNHMELLKKSIIESDDFDLRNESKSEIALDVNKKLDPICESKDELKPGGSYKTVLDVGSLKLQSENKAIDDKVPANQDLYLKQESIATNVPSQTNQSSGSYESKIEEITSTDHPDWYMIETTTKGTSCKFCNVTIPNTMKNKIEHLNGSKHKRTVSELLELNRLIVKNGLFYCEYCNDYMKNELQYNHIQHESHKKNIKLNETEIKSTDDNIATVIAESNSDQNNDKVNPVKDIETNKITTEVTTKEMANDNIPTTSKAIEEAIEYNPLIMEKTPKGNEITCKICNVIVPLRNCNIQEHLKAQKHKNNEKVLLEKNKIIIKDSRSRGSIGVRIASDGSCGSLSSFVPRGRGRLARQAEPS
ncbi:uncharacterized protein LOC106716020 [Papilio machaon]|uniref:uncharacterized protein LOC106716020 n=1 Tax=Papilio machaon TaxID=76193 RepID=UPI001E663455|nr:uncharacterized protein LOC106716020 [Papilio machaon]